MLTNISALPKILVLSGAVLLSSAPLLPAQTPQQPAPAAPTAPTLKVTTRTVIVDVVVNEGGKPVRDLKQADFTLLEDGKAQKVDFFEPHFADMTKAGAITPAAPLPEGTYTNIPAAHVNDSVTVLLLDSLNTEIADQAYVRSKMIGYLKALPKGRRIAIFTLGSQLRMLADFNADTAPLIAVLDSKQGGPQLSTLRSQSDENQDRQLMELMRESGASEDSLMSYMDFILTDTSALSSTRTDKTLEALQQLARYLSAIPGRKNLVWFAGSFPTDLLPGENDPSHLSRDNSRSYANDLHATADLLAAARVAVYPVDAGGAKVGAMFSSANGVGASSVAGGSGQRLNNETAGADVQALSEHTTMDELAKETGGRAVYNSNGLMDAIDHALNDGSSFYTVAYSPTNQNYNGAPRKIDIKVTGGKYQLLFRRSYLADPDAPPPSPGPMGPNSVFVTAMRRGVPAATQIAFDVRVVPAGPQPPPAPIAGQNTDLKGSLTRYAIDYAADPRAISLNRTPKGFHQGQVVIVTAAFDRNGKSLNAVSTTQPIAVGPDAYASFRQSGIQLHQIIDLPNGALYLRTGIYDPTSGHMGTLEIPLKVGNKESNTSPAAK
jgi:VWFA-related protein